MKKPAQKRSAQTYEKILDTAASLLDERGFDKLNTNLICERAGITPPALYRYFPNKYAILSALGERLMTAQNDALAIWIDQATEINSSVEQLQQMLREQFDITVAQKGGASIMRALRSTPQLADVRLHSHAKMTALIIARLQEIDPSVDEAMQIQRNRLTMEMGYAAMEMLIDLPDMDVDQTLHDVATMMAALS